MENNPSIIGTTLSHLPPGVTEHLGYYVYIYLDPRTLQPFYVGKGKGERILAHLNDDLESEKVRIIADLRSNGMSPQLEVLAHGLRDEETAFRVEAAAIDLLGLDNLSNKVRGWKSLQTGRMTLDELIGYYAAEPVEITHPALLIRVNQLYRHNLPADELYEITRGIWKLGERRMGVNYAMAVFEGVVREVYAVTEWHPALSTHYSVRQFGDRDGDGRWEFIGEVAVDEVRSRYRLRSVKEYFRQGNQSPTVYVNC